MRWLSSVSANTADPITEEPLLRPRAWAAPPRQHQTLHAHSGSVRSSSRLRVRAQSCSDRRSPGDALLALVRSSCTAASRVSALAAVRSFTLVGQEEGAVLTNSSARDSPHFARFREYEAIRSRRNYRRRCPEARTSADYRNRTYQSAADGKTTTKMKFTHYDLGQCKRGQKIEVTLQGNAANVLLLDSTNLSAYRNGRRYRYQGGLARRSPVILQIPRTGRWHVAVDMSGLRGQVRSSIRMLPGALPEIRQGPSDLGAIADVAAAAAPPDSGQVSAKESDVFVCHASEDKDGLVRDLAHALDARGLTVWYDEFEMQVGDSLRRKIDAGIAACRFGLVVFSPAFFAKNWSQYELDGLVTREMTGEQIILPLWHQISKDEVVAQSPSLADKVAIRTADFTVEEIADEIARVTSERLDEQAA